MGFSGITLDILHNVLFFLSLIYALELQSNPLELNRSENHDGAFLLTLFIAFMLGAYDIGYGWSADRERYARSFVNFVTNDTPWQKVLSGDEWFFYGYMKFLSFLRDPQIWLHCTALIYVFNYFVVAKRTVPDNVFLMLLVMVGSFGFISYGVNTIRSGFALSFVLVGLTYYQNLYKSLLFFFIAYNIHHSTVIPIAAFLVARYYNHPKMFYYFWFLCVALSAVTGNLFPQFFSALGQDFDNRVAYLTTTETHYHIGFRIDFVIYSCLPIIMGNIYQKRLEYQSEFYAVLHSTYVIANAFWILVIRANFSDRFAYLSWFMYALVMVYPLLDQPEHFSDIGKKVAVAVMVVTGFTYFMYLK